LKRLWFIFKELALGPFGFITLLLVIILSLATIGVITLILYYVLYLISNHIIGPLTLKYHIWHQTPFDQDSRNTSTVIFLSTLFLIGMLYHNTRKWMKESLKPALALAIVEYEEKQKEILEPKQELLRASDSFDSDPRLVGVGNDNSS
jgi:hypothetical protein